MNLAKFGRKWPKMWPTCIFRPGEGSEGLKNGFAERSYRGAEPSYRGAERSYRGAVRSYRGAERSYRGAERSYRGAQSYLGGKKWPKSKISFCLVHDSLRGTF